MEEANSILDELDEPKPEASGLQRIMANVIDMIVEVAIIVCFYLFTPPQIIQSLLNLGNAAWYIFIFALLMGYRTLFILLSGKTVGMRVVKIIFLNNELQPLTTKEKLFASFIPKVKNIRLYKDR